MKSLGAPDFTTVKLNEEGGFSNYNEYQTALIDGASTIGELKLVEQLHVHTFEEAKSILKAGFTDLSTYHAALAKGILYIRSWQRYLDERTELLANYKRMRKDMDRD